MFYAVSRILSRISAPLVKTIIEKKEVEVANNIKIIIILKYMQTMYRVHM